MGTILQKNINIAKMNHEKIILVTGGAGFIGSHLVRFFVSTYPEYFIINLDKLTYAGNLANLKDIEQSQNYIFIKGDIQDSDLLDNIFRQYQPDTVIHLAAESHVDRSILNPLEFVQTNVLGTCTLLNIAKNHWINNLPGKLFYHVSTDEVFGSLGDDGFFREDTSYDPRSPYSASKASSDHFVRAYYHTFKLPVIISNCSNNYGSYQFPEKLLPLMINNIIHKKPLPVYGKGENIRDWLYVVDHVKAIDLIIRRGRIGETYCIGGNNEWKNIDLIHELCNIMDGKLGRQKGESAALINYVTDRAGHDMRYAIYTGKIATELGWKPEVDFTKGLSLTADWYLNNRSWLDNVTSGDYLNYYDNMYAGR
jgi:dTDP-glucose 4,6-dehydratase